MRLAAQGNELIDRSSSVSFRFEGRPVTGFAGDTIGSALYAGGRRVFVNSPARGGAFYFNVWLLTELGQAQSLYR